MPMLNNLKKTIVTAILIVISFYATSAQEVAAPWFNLFDGKTLNGWEQKGGGAKYFVENGSIVGQTIANIPNSFLCTKNDFGDFILEYDVFLDRATNSGVQFRSHSNPGFKNGMVYGYQCEIDPSDRKWSGGIYDESFRGWLFPVINDANAQSAFKMGQWNHFRIEAIGANIKTFVNEIPVANLEDDYTKSGFIALQVHGIGNKKDDEGIHIKWKNIRIITDRPEKYATKTTVPLKQNYNTLTKTEKEAGWKLLWDGESATGWKSSRGESFPANGWEIKNGILSVLESDGAESSRGGDIVTTENFSNFELMVDFKLNPGANSGIKYFVDRSINKQMGSAIGLEYQLLDDNIHPDAKLGRVEGIRTLASLYDLKMAVNKTPNYIGEWNHARIISNKNHVEHWLNGVKVLEYERGSEEYRKLVSESKYAGIPGFGEITEGPILLQDHGNKVSFRNIKIRVIK